MFTCVAGSVINKKLLKVDKIALGHMYTVRYIESVTHPMFLIFHVQKIEASQSDIDWYQKPPGSCSSHLLNPARDQNMQIRRDPYSLESTRLDPQNRGFTRVARGEQPISERLGIDKYGVKWKVIAFVD